MVDDPRFYIGMLIFCSVGLGFMLGLLCFKVINWEEIKEWLKDQITAK